MNLGGCVQSDFFCAQSFYEDVANNMSESDNTCSPLFAHKTGISFVSHTHNILNIRDYADESNRH